MLYMVTFTINIPPMLAYIPYMDPMGYLKHFKARLWTHTHTQTSEQTISSLWAITLYALSNLLHPERTAWAR